MKTLYDFAVTIVPVFCVATVITGCSGAPVVKPSCSISWDRAVDWRVAEYRVTAMRLRDGTADSKVMHKVKAPATQLSCLEAGTQAEGIWQVTIEACLQDNTCSAPSKPISFKVVNQ